MSEKTRASRRSKTRFSCELPRDLDTYLNQVARRVSSTANRSEAVRAILKEARLRGLMLATD